MKRIVLASASPRRRELLQQIGLEFEAEPGDHAETIDSGLEPHRLARKLAYEKARAVAQKQQDAIVIAADTLVVLDGRVLGKPRDAQHARETLRTLSGRTHSVITGFTILDTGSGKTISRSVETRVRIRKLTSREISAYVSSGEPLDKAGAYAIQGLGALIVDSIEGDYYNVVGLPLSALAEGLKDFGVNILAR